MGERFGYKEKIHAKLSDLSLACTQKAHLLQTLRKSQIGFLKIVEIKAKYDERQGKTSKIFEKLCILSPLLIS